MAGQGLFVFRYKKGLFEDRDEDVCTETTNILDNRLNKRLLLTKRGGEMKCPFENLDAKDMERGTKSAVNTGMPFSPRLLTMV